MTSIKALFIDAKFKLCISSFCDVAKKKKKKSKPFLASPVLNQQNITLTSGVGCPGAF